MTVSFHKYGDFFPGTGALGDIGTGGGAGYSVNVPLQEGMDDESYRYVFEPIMTKVYKRKLLFDALTGLLDFPVCMNHVMKQARERAPMCVVD